MASSLRVSDADRERVAEALRRGWCEGYLSFETFSERLDLAYRARSWLDLRGLVADLPVGRLGPLIALWSRVRATLLPEPDPRADDGSPGKGDEGDVALELPGRPDVSLVLGRAADCALRLLDDTVSRRHAEIRCEDGVWVVTDLASTNGVYVNGRRVWRAELRAGDHIWLGSTSLRVAGDASDR